MNATRWVTLTEFIKHLGREGIVRVDENEKGFWIAWVDTSPKALAKQAESQKRERMDMDEEQRQRKQLQEQIERARLQEEARKSQLGDQTETGLQRAEGTKVTLSLAPTNPTGDKRAGTEESNEGPQRDAQSGSSLSTATTVKLSNPLKRPATTNVFKAAKVAKIGGGAPAGGDSEAKASSMDKRNLSGKKFLTAAERLMLEDQERLAKQHPRKAGAYQGAGPSRR